MTREEAIQELEFAKAMCEFDPTTGEVGFRNAEDERQYEAFSMAIEALSDVPDTNVGKLIPCSERLPEADKEVFVYIYDMPFIAWVDKNGEWNTETFTLDKELEKDDEPIAWMPLPKSYRGDEE